MILCVSHADLLSHIACCSMVRRETAASPDVGGSRRARDLSLRFSGLKHPLRTICLENERLFEAPASAWVVASPIHSLVPGIQQRAASRAFDTRLRQQSPTNATETLR